LYVAVVFILILQRYEFLLTFANSVIASYGAVKQSRLLRFARNDDQEPYAGMTTR